mgnify:CR=1 FL=1
MIKLSRIVCPSDFSQTSSRAVDYAATMAVSLDAELIVLHVIPKMDYPLRSFGISGSMEHIQEEMMTRAEENLAERIKLLQEEYNPQWRLIAEEAARAGAEFDVDNIKQSSTFAVGALESFLEAADADIAKKFRAGDPIVLGKMARASAARWIGPEMFAELEESGKLRLLLRHNLAAMLAIGAAGGKLKWEETELERALADDELDDEEKEKHLLRKEAGLVRSGRLFGGLIDDFYRKKPWFMKDFTDALSMKTVASVIFIYFATLAPTVAFGGLLGDATDNRMASIECLVAGLIAGVLFGMFSGQPLTILGVTGTAIVFESIVVDICKSVI